MPKITYISHSGASRTIDVLQGDSIMEGAVQNPDEDSMLESAAATRKMNSRLSCQIRVRPEHDGCTVHTPDTQ
jgi:ferredoxin